MSALKPPPKFVTNLWAWAHTLDKLRDKGQLDEGGNPRNYGAAVAIYKNTAKKYGDDNDRIGVASERELTRAELLECDGAIWVAARGMAWAANDDAHMVLTPTDGGWHLERHTDDDVIDGKLDQGTAEWLLRDSPTSAIAFVTNPAIYVAT